MIKAMKRVRARATLVLSLALVLGLAAANLAVAEPAPIPIDPNTYAEITKVIERPMGVPMPDGGFNFSATPRGLDGAATTGGVTFPVIESLVMSADENDGIYPDVWAATVPEAEWGIRSVERPARFQLGDLEFPQAGVFDYLVETQPTDIAGMTDAPAQYILRLNVGADRQINNVALHSFTGGNIGGEVDTARFVSVYTPGGGTLSVTNNVIGDGADTSKEFDFRIRLTSTSFVDERTPVEGRITNEAGSSLGSQTLYYDRWFSFSLSHGMSLEFSDLPLGTAFMVEERMETDYSASVSVVINGGVPWEFNAAATDRKLSSEAALGQSFLVENRVVGAADNTVTFTNYLPEATEAGWFNLADMLWLIIIGGIFLVVVVIIIVIRRRQV